MPSLAWDDTLILANQNWQLLPVIKYLMLRGDEDFWLAANWLVAKVLRKPISYDQFTLLYELDTLQLMYSTNDNICVGLVKPNFHLPNYFGETGITTPRNRWLSIRFVPLTLSLFFFVFCFFFWRFYFSVNNSFLSRSLAEGRFSWSFVSS